MHKPGLKNAEGTEQDRLRTRSLNSHFADQALGPSGKQQAASVKKI